MDYSCNGLEEVLDPHVAFSIKDDVAKLFFEVFPH
jgi:hypothetical protein